MTKRRWDIFCKVVDNYGDIGVCWRLARQLAQEFPHIQIRLFVDNDATIAKIIPQFLSGAHQQTIQKIEICDWKLAEQANADVVLETFGCDLPAAYLQNMQTTKPAWINLEYLSAENWVADFHGKPSLHPSLGLNKHFYFPGFTAETGGLIREQSLLKRRDAFLAQHLPHDSLKISLFCYPQAQIKSLLIALQHLTKNQSKKVTLYIPYNNALSEIFSTFSDIFPDFNYTIDKVYQTENLTIHVLPFLSQAEYDQLLWQCDLNFVRGEDSWIRAIWAGKPFIWQPYIQTDDTHITKLNAFLQAHFFQANDAFKTLMLEASHAWSGYNNIAFNTTFQKLIAELPTFAQYFKQQANALAEQKNLASELVAFSENLLKNKV